MKNTLKKLFFLFLSFYSVCWADPFLDNFTVPKKDVTPYRSPTKRFLSKHSYTLISSKLRAQGIFLKQKKSYDALIGFEERGHMGYSASGHQFRVFQDIIRMTVEEILKLEIKKDFYFFRVPGETNVNDHPDARDFLKKFPNVNDNKENQRDQLISANFTLYNNFHQKYECSAVFFEKSISFKPPNFEERIASFFDALGMPKESVRELFQIGQMIENKDGGTLFQLFDFSHHNPNYKNAYEFIDKHCYPCRKKGVPLYTTKQLSDLLQGTMESNFLEQYRIVINHFQMLNPFSSIYIRRYDLNSGVVIQEYEKKLRSYIQKLKYDPLKASLFKQKLMQYWNI